MSGTGWKARLRTPRGQLWLFGTTWISATVFAAFMGTQNERFVTLVREKYGTETVDEQRAADAIVDTPGEPQTPEALESLYRHWMRAGESPDPRFPAALAAANRAWLISRIERTLVTGTPLQRRRALSLAKAAKLDEARPMLQLVLERTRRMGPAELVPDLEGALEPHSP